MATIAQRSWSINLKKSWLQIQGGLATIAWQSSDDRAAIVSHDREPWTIDVVWSSSGWVDDLDRTIKLRHDWEQHLERPPFDGDPPPDEESTVRWRSPHQVSRRASACLPLIRHDRDQLWPPDGDRDLMKISTIVRWSHVKWLILAVWWRLMLPRPAMCRPSSVSLKRALAHVPNEWSRGLGSTRSTPCDRYWSPTMRPRVLHRRNVWEHSPTRKKKIESVSFITGRFSAIALPPQSYYQGH